MATEKYSLDESRKLAVLMARVWSDPQLAVRYRETPEAVLSGAGIELQGRAAPEIPERPAGIGDVGIGTRLAASSASSLSTFTCPCTGCTASCAGLAAVDVLEAQIAAMSKLAEDPAGREAARRMTASWKVASVNS